MLCCFCAYSPDKDGDETEMLADERNILIPGLTIVEEDGWKYEGFYHDGESMVCSSFVTAVWKAAGLFGDLKINAVEWLPKDVY